MKPYSEKKRIGIMGGTFDPIHQAHLVAAEWVKTSLGLEEVLFIPTGKPAHKRDGTVTKAEYRLEMVRLATAGNPSFFVSDMEILRSGLTYTYDTILTLKQKYGSESEIFFIIGTDSLLDIHKWYKSKELMSLTYFVAVTRPGFSDALIVAEKNRLEREFGAHIELVEIPDMGVSSTMIRSRVRQALSIRYLVPDNVLEFISKKGLYKNVE